MSYKLTLQKLTALLSAIDRRLDECARVAREISIKKNKKLRKSKSYESFFN